MTLKEKYQSLLIRQFVTKPKIKGEIGILADLAVEFNEVLKKLNLQLDLDTSTGKQLDILGKIVGFSRSVYKFDGEGNITGYYDLEDEDYRFLLRFKVADNFNNACMSSYNGNSINDVVNFAFRGQGYVEDNKNMTLTLIVKTISNIDRIRLLLRLDLLPRPQGVTYTGAIVKDDGFFGFSDNSKAKSFYDLEKGSSPQDSGHFYEIIF